MKLSHQLKEHTFLNELYEPSKTESIYYVGLSHEQVILKTILSQSRLNLIGYGSELNQIESFMDSNLPDALIINIDEEYDTISGYQMVKLLKIEYDLPFIVLQKLKSNYPDKWVSELNPDGHIYLDQSTQELKTEIEKAFN